MCWGWMEAGAGESKGRQARRVATVRIGGRDKWGAAGVKAPSMKGRRHEERPHPCTGAQGLDGRKGTDAARPHLALHLHPCQPRSAAALLKDCRLLWPAPSAHTRGLGCLVQNSEIMTNYPLLSWLSQEGMPL